MAQEGSRLAGALATDFPFGARAGALEVVIVGGREAPELDGRAGDREALGDVQEAGGQPIVAVGAGEDVEEDERPGGVEAEARRGVARRFHVVDGNRPEQMAVDADAVGGADQDRADLGARVAFDIRVDPLGDGELGGAAATEAGGVAVEAGRQVDLDVLGRGDRVELAFDRLLVVGGVEVDRGQLVEGVAAGLSERRAGGVGAFAVVEGGDAEGGRGERRDGRGDGRDFPAAPALKAEGAGELEAERRAGVELGGDADDDVLPRGDGFGVGAGEGALGVFAFEGKEAGHEALDREIGGQLAAQLDRAGGGVGGRVAEVLELDLDREGFAGRGGGVGHRGEAPGGAVGGW